MQLSIKLNLALLLLVGLVFVAMMRACLALPVPTSSRMRVNSASNEVREPPLDKFRGVCANKGKICEVICKNNPSEGGKFCNCDTYALRASAPSYANCNKLI